MGKKDVVHPGQFKLGGRLRPGKDTNPHLMKQDFGENKAQTSGPGGVESAPPKGSPQTQEQGGVQRTAPKAGAVGPPREQQENMDVTSATGRKKEQAETTGAGEPSRAPAMEASDESGFTPGAAIPGETAPEPPRTQAAGAGGGNGRGAARRRIEPPDLAQERRTIDSKEA